MTFSQLPSGAPPGQLLINLIFPGEIAVSALALSRLFVFDKTRSRANLHARARTRVTRMRFCLILGHGGWAFDPCARPRARALHFNNALPGPRFRRQSPCAWHALLSVRGAAHVFCPFVHGKRERGTEADGGGGEWSYWRWKITLRIERREG